MRSVHDVISIIKESNYFTPWAGILLSDHAIESWQQLIEHSTSKNFYESIAEDLYNSNVPFVIVTEYMDEFFRYIDNHQFDRYAIKNDIAKAFLRKKLQADYHTVEIELTAKLSLALENKRELINAHLIWMQTFIVSIIEEPQPLELDSTRCHVGLWLLEENITQEHETINRLHQNLHAMAQSALRMYEQDDFAYFLLLYLDILMASYQIRDLIMNLYFSRRITSIYRDPLSKQANYFQLRDDIQTYESDSSLFMFNIKEFSKINLLYGHKIGDNIIKAVADELSAVKGITTSYRIYGDEFAILLPTKERNVIIEHFKKRIENRQFHVKNSTITLSFYSSISKVTPHVLEHCEYGLMISKAHHGIVTNVDAISESTLEKYASNITLSQQLRLAFLDNRIIPYFQPILDLKTGSITKYEVLMRVKDLDGNILVPKEFLKVLQNMYIYPEVTKLIIKKAFNMFKDKEYEFSINLSFADIIDLGTEEFIIAMIKRYPDVAKRCTFELLENETIHNQKEIRDFFDLLHSYGVKIALDDFGVGYSNYDTIFNFDIDYIKIDGSLTESMITNHKSYILMESISAVARELNAKTVVEFVSSAELFDMVKKIDVDYVQGYHIGKPSPTLNTEKMM
jgi:diguanylate cyclase (GGDEF)-like protein